MSQRFNQMNMCRLANSGTINRNKIKSLLILFQLITVFVILSDAYSEIINKKIRWKVKVY